MTLTIEGAFTSGPMMTPTTSTHIHYIIFSVGYIKNLINLSYIQLIILGSIQSEAVYKMTEFLCTCILSKQFPKYSNAKGIILFL